MIPLNLLDELVDRFKEEFKEFNLKDPKNPENYKTINTFPQHLPPKSKDSELSMYPYLCIRLTEGGEDSEDNPGNCQVLFIAGVFDRTSDNQGFRDAITVIQKVYQNLIRNPVVNKQFELVHPIRWTYQDEDAGPYYFAGLETNWEAPKPIREDVEDLI